MNYLNFNNIEKALVDFYRNQPFPHCVIDNFFNTSIVETLSNEFPDWDSDIFNGFYQNDLETKKTCNVWDRFPPIIYKVLHYLNSTEFVDYLKNNLAINTLYSDQGLHGGGLHIYPPQGKLNIHLDYNIHPKLNLYRKFNLLIYLNKNYQNSWLGELGLWEGKDQPEKLIKKIEPIFNRAIFFDTSCNSWHGLEIPNNFPSGQYRKSLALYYLVDVGNSDDQRYRALFAPNEDQKNDQKVLDLIKSRNQMQGKDPVFWIRS